MSAAHRHILLVNLQPSEGASYRHRGGSYPATGLLLIGTVLKAAGYSVTVIDGAYDSNYLEALDKTVRRNPTQLLFCGFSVMTTQVPMALRASKVVKSASPGLTVVWGGPHPTLFPEQTLASPLVDVIAINEAAHTVVDLAHALVSGAALSSVKGIGYKPPARRPAFTPPAALDALRQLPHLDFSLITSARYLDAEETVYDNEFPQIAGRIRAVPILTGLGCPYRCQFCINVILKRRYRFRDAADIVSEIQRLKRSLKANTFIFMDEDFFINKRRALAFIDLALSKGLRFNWRMWCRVDHFKPDYIDGEVLARLERLGKGSLVMGAESASQECLDNLDKEITTDQIRHSVNLLKTTGIHARYSFMVGLENERLSQIRRTFDFCFELKAIHPAVDIAGPYIFRLYPGSPIYRRIVRQHDMTTPKTLEEWAPHLAGPASAVTDLPWTPPDFQKSARLIEFLTDHAMPVRCPSGGFKSLLAYLLGVVARWRLKHFLFTFPAEYWLALAFRHYRQRRDSASMAP